MSPKATGVDKWDKFSASYRKWFVIIFSNPHRKLKDDLSNNHLNDDFLQFAQRTVNWLSIDQGLRVSTRYFSAVLNPLIHCQKIISCHERPPLRLCNIYFKKHQTAFQRNDCFWQPLIKMFFSHLWITHINHDELQLRKIFTKKVESNNMYL